MPPSFPPTNPIKFGPYLVTPQVFHTTALSFCLVNIKPLLPGHVLVSPLRPVPRLTDLTAAEITDLFATVKRVTRMLERVYGATSLNIAIQDGADAGQSVPHVHAHLIPRHKADLDSKGGTDVIYEMMDGEEGDVGAHLEERKRGRTRFPRVDNEERKPRSEEEMNQEAAMLAKEMEKETDE